MLKPGRRASRVFALAFAAAASFAVAMPAVAQTISNVRVEGNKRVETEAVRVHITAAAGKAADRAVVDRDIKEIYAMGLFDNVWATLRRTPGVVDLVSSAQRPDSASQLAAASTRRRRPGARESRLHPGNRGSLGRGH